MGVGEGHISDFMFSDVADFQCFCNLPIKLKSNFIFMDSTTVLKARHSVYYVVPPFLSAVPAATLSTLSVSFVSFLVCLHTTSNSHPPLSDIGIRTASRVSWFQNYTCTCLCLFPLLIVPHPLITYSFCLLVISILAKLGICKLHGTFRPVSHIRS